MLEVLFQKAREGMAGEGSGPFRWMRILPPGVWIILAVVGFVGGRLHQVRASRPPHREEIAAAFGSVTSFYGTPQMSHDGSHFTYVSTMATRGTALFLYDVVHHQQREVLREEDGPGYWHDDFDLRTGPWSPDDSSFICFMQNKLIICPTDTNLPVARLEIGNNPGVVWVNPEEFAWLERETMCYARKSVDGKWEIRKLPHQGQILSLTAIDDETIAWLQSDFICRLKLTDDLSATNNPFVLLSREAVAAPLTNHLALWLDASVLQATNRAPVTNLPDLSRGRNNALYVKNAPTWNATNSPGALNGKGTIHFESGDTRTNATGLRTTAHLGISGSKPRSVFAVMRRNSGRYSAMLVNLGTLGTPGGYFGLCDQNGALWLPSGAFTNGNDGKLAGLPASWHILETVYDGTNAKGYVNGALRGTVTQPFKTADTQVEIGLRSIGLPATNSWASDGDFAELMIYDQALSAEQMRQVEDYVGVKWFHSRPISTATSFVWLDPQLSGMTGFTYSKDTGRFLITRTENGRDSVWRLDSATATRSEAKQIIQGRISDAQWIGTNEFAYTSTQAGRPGLVLMDASGVEMNRLFERGNFRWFGVAPDQKQILFWGSISNIPSPGIWQFDVKSQRLDPVVPYADHPSPLAGMITPFHTTLNLGGRRNVRCVIFPPSAFDPHKKYPLILGDTLVSDAIHGPMFESGMAACGAYVAIVERNNWGDGIEQWADNVLKFYQTLKDDPAIDPSQVFLFGASAETEYMGQLAEKTPGLWKGMILLNPGKLPDFSKSPQFHPRPKILLSAGGEEDEDAKFRKYQQDALEWGVLVTVHVAPGETHRFVGKAGKFQRSEAVMRFIFED